LDKICLIHQPAGIGDVFFLQYVARKYMAMGYHVIWPLKDEILWIKDYILDIEFCSRQDEFPGKQYYGQDVVILSPQFVYLGLDKPHFWQNNYGVKDEDTCMVMHSKYLMMQLDWTNWSEGFQFDRKIDKENDLYYNVLGLKDDSEYIFVNRYANTENRRNDQLTFPEFDLPVIDLQILKGFSLFDWCKVIENAQEIHTVHTSMPYLIDRLNIKAKKYYMYQGIHQPNVEHIPFLNNTPVWVPN
tara:strand:- start:1986 stop:2717 length:732 start_codon:yes stop_codon:yes gene_type:complete